ncbi:hypothetical protein POM88_003632 [Heracleum sosnowskyi]|uniref:Uncharacterized protein n=1 Tax=Heracleum sosnowskyi TaxID=360622 RepID=A0AAD8NCG6_9APIA|nr:hypothetical protein POM88_003632 [Heracleum sosnowskyi]
MHHIPGLYLQNLAHSFIFQHLQSAGLNRLSGSSVLDGLQSDPSTLLDNISGRYQVEKKEKYASSKTTTPSMEVFAALPRKSYTEECLFSYAQKKTLQELLNAMSLVSEFSTNDMLSIKETTSLDFEFFET